MLGVWLVARALDNLKLTGSGAPSTCSYIYPGACARWAVCITPHRLLQASLCHAGWSVQWALADAKPGCRLSLWRRHEERCTQQHTGLEHQQHTEPDLDGPGSSSPNMEVLLAAVEQAEPALQAAAPAAAATEDSMAAAAATVQPAAAGSSPLLAAHSAQVAQRRVDQALQAFEEAVDARSPEGMLRPLGLLALVGHGGSILQGLLHCWSSLGLERQRQVFDAALVAAGQGAWPQLEARLQAALGPGNTPGR